MGLIISDTRSASIHAQGRSEIFRVLADAGAMGVPEIPGAPLWT